MTSLKTISITCMAITLLCLFSCKSTPEKKIDSSYVMVYDNDNSEVMNVSIYMDGKEIGKTDIYGRLVFPCVKEKEVIMRAEKPTYESVEMKTKIKPGLLLYFKIRNGSYYAEQAEKKLDENNTEEALKLIDKALEIDARKDWCYLKDVILRRVKNDQ